MITQPLQLRMRLGGALFGGVFFASLIVSASFVLLPASAQTAQSSATISKVQPSSGGRGQFVTILGANFGSVPGDVFVVQGKKSVPATTMLPGKCSALYWHDSYIVIAVPQEVDLGSVSFDVQKKGESARAHGGAFRVTDASPSTGICGVLPDNGIPGAPLEIFGVNFGGKGFAKIGSANLTLSESAWTNTHIASEIPVSQNGFLSIVTADKDKSNPIPFTFGRCSQESCREGSSCCSDGSCKPTGECKEKVAMCRYSWSFYTGDLAGIGDACSDGSQCVSGVCGVERKCIQGSKKEGDRCGFDAECQFGLACKGGKCVSVLKRMGDACSANAECSSGACDGGVCRQGTKAPGEACTSREQCASLNCYKGKCGQTERCLRVESVLPIPSQVTTQTVFTIIFNQLIDEKSAIANVSIDPSVKLTADVSALGQGDSAKTQVTLRPNAPLSIKQSYSVRVGNGVKSLSSENTIGRCVTGQNTCTKAGEVCSEKGAVCSNGARCTGPESACHGSGTVCTGSHSTCDTGATCIGAGSVCIGSGTTCLGANSICRDGARCPSDLSRCMATASSCPNPNTVAISSEKKGPGSACAFNDECRSGTCNPLSHSCSGGSTPDGGTCAANAQCASGSCVANVCAPLPPNHGDPVGSPCARNAQCASGLCANNACVDPGRGSSNIVAPPPDAGGGVIAPAAPSDLAARGLSSSIIEVTWKNNAPDATRIVIERQEESGVFIEVARAGSTVTTFVDRDLKTFTIYTYRLKALRATVESPYSNTANARTHFFNFCLKGRPQTPANVHAEAVLGTQANVGWSAVSDADGIRIERSVDNAVFSSVYAVGGGESAYRDPDLSVKTAYWYRVSAFNCAGSSAVSTSVSITTADSSVQNPIVTPDPITNPTPAPGPVCKENSSCTSGTCDIVRGLCTCATNADCNGSACDLATHLCPAPNQNPNPPANTKPLAPADLIGTALSTSEIQLSWRDASSNESGFIVEHSRDGGATFTTAVRLAADPVSIVDAHLAQFITYQFRVKAFNDAGESEYSNTIKLGTKWIDLCFKTAPSAPSSLTASAASKTQIDLLWTAASESDIRYRI